MTLTLIVDRPAWHAQAACQGRTAEMFPTDAHGQALAARICHDCEVQAPCLLYALEHHIKFGTWGGTSEHMRRLIWRGHR